MMPTWRLRRHNGYYTSNLTPWERSFRWQLDRPHDDETVIDVSSRSGLALAVPNPDTLDPPTISRHRTGTCFDVESTEMRAACVPAIEAMLGGDVTLHEVRHQHNGYHTDLVVADVDPDGLREWHALTIGQHPLHDPLQRFKTWWHLLENGPKTRHDAVEEGLYSDPSKNRQHVDWLLDHGYLARTSAGALVSIEPPRVAELHAVELKLRDWETALEQADRANRCDGYRDVDEHVHVARMRDDGTMPAFWRDRYGYADYRWVALDAGAIRPALEHRDVFEERGVGLLAVAEGGAVVKHVDAEHAPRERYTRDRAWAESEVRDALDLDAWLQTPSESSETDGQQHAQPGLATFSDGGDPG